MTVHSWIGKGFFREPNPHEIAFEQIRAYFSALQVKRRKSLDY